MPTTVDESRLTCPRCDAPRIDALDCPRCGVIYAKAEARLAVAPEPPPFELPETPSFAPVLPPTSTAWEGERTDAELELKIRLFAIPVAMTLAVLAMNVPPLRSLSRVFLSMWVHELGHATTAWFGGLFAFPGPWRTPVGESRSFVVFVLLAAALGLLAYRGHQHERRSWMVIAGGLFVVQLVGTLALPLDTLRMLVTFGGDGGCFVLGSVLMASMYAGSDTQIHKGWLRWGFLVIGAVAFADAFHTWWEARTNFAAIPFGEIERVGLSDASKLVDHHGWGARELVQRHLKLALACLVALAALYGWGIFDARRRVQETAAD